MNIPYSPEHYYQNQGMVPGTGPVECVTTCVAMVRNMVKDRLAQDLEISAMPDIPVNEYVKKLNGMPLSGLFYRFPSNFFLAGMRGWMMPVLQLPGALKQSAWEMRLYYGRSFQVRQTSANSLEGIRQALRNGEFVLVHGLWPVDKSDKIHDMFGGFPHTMIPVQIDYRAGKVILLNSADPHPTTVNPYDPSTYPAGRLYEMPIQEFMSFWGRRSLLNLYTRPFTMTVVIPDAHTR